jgi:LPPG:FO 2-phospho-L-lactate transferase
MSGRVVVLTGGVGGAKLVLGLTKVISAARITAIVNTGDDFRHLGLWVSPDIDTLLYTLSGQSNQVQGWGREGETWNFMAALRSVGGEDWFALGDGDLALHVLRSRALAAGQNLSDVTRDFARSWNIAVEILPMSDEPVQTVLSTDEGELPFQRYFVQRRCEPKVQAIRFEGASDARPATGVTEAISDPSNRAILIAPSNPYLSIDPILAVRGIREALAAAPAPIIAVTPIVGGAAVKGPTAKLMKELGVEVSAAAVAAHYDGLIDGFLADERDCSIAVPIQHAFADTMMNTLEDRARVAAKALDLASATLKP